MLEGTIINILLLASALVGLIIAGIIYLSDKNSLTNRLLSAVLVLAAIWGISIFATILSGSVAVGNISFAASSLMPAVLVLFILSFRGQLDKKKIWLVLSPAFVMAVLTNLPNAISEAIRTDRGYIEVINYGYLLWVFDVYFFIYAGIFLYLLVRARIEESGIRQVQLKYLIFGFAASLIFGSLFNIILPLFGIYQFNNLGPVFILFMSSTMAYAATKHYLREVQVIFSEIWAFILLFVVLIWLLVHLSIFNSLLFLLILGVCVMFIRSVISEARKNFILIDQKKQLEEDTEKLKALDKLKDDFLKMATHELNTPVTVIQGKMSMIFDENLGNFDPNHKEFLSPVFKNSSRLIELIREILDTLKIDQGEMAITLLETDLVEVITKIIDKMKQEAVKKNVEIIFDSPKEEIPHLNIDALKIQNVIFNFLSNAVKFSPQDGKVVVDLNIIDGYLVMSVADSGVGISVEDQRHIFEKFYQAKRFDVDAPQEQQGTGLGLYISKKFIEMHKGKMWFKSEEGKGSKFFFALPI